MSRRTTPARKAAIAVVALGAERATALLQGFDENEVRALAAEIAELESVTPEEVRAALREITSSVRTNPSLPPPGVGFAREILHRALGPDRGEQAAAELEAPKPFEWLASIEPRRAAPILAAEAPGAVALALAHLRPHVAATFLAELPEESRAEVAHRIAALGQVLPSTVAEVEAALRRRLANLRSQRTQRIDGPSVLAELLAHSDRDQERAMLDELATADPELADATRDLLVTFDDVMDLEQRDMQALLRGVETRSLGIALTTASEEQKERVLSNLSERARENLLEEMELLTNLPQVEVTVARKEVVAAARRLEEQGLLTLARPGVRA